MKKETTSISILGHGWLTQALTEYWRENDLEFQYKAYSRSGKQGSTPFTLSTQTLELPKEMQESDALFLSLPPGRDIEGYCQIILNLTKLLSSSHRVIMIGTTSVFENNEGNCSEDTTPLASSERAKKLREAEEIFLGYFKKGLVIRSGGQIGKDRAPARFLAKKADPNQMPQGNIPVNLIHQDDLVRICTLAIKEQLCGVLHAVSPYHPNKSDYYKAQAKHLGLKLMEFPTGEPSQKRIDSLTLKNLGYSFVNEKCEL